MKLREDNLNDWIKHWLPIFEKELDERWVMLVKLRTGMVDGIQHTYDAIALLITNHSEYVGDKKHICRTRARVLYAKAVHKLKRHVIKYDITQ